MYRHAVAIVPQRATGDDRAAVFERGDCLVVALADGSGGSSFAAESAQAVIDAAANAQIGTDWVALLSELDAALRGRTTAIVLEVTRDGIRGASVGDSEAWLVRGDEIAVLTARQERKPLLGDGALAVAFDARCDGILLLGSDGLVKYAPRRDIARAAAALDPAALVALVRMPGGGLQDDVSVVLVQL